MKKTIEKDARFKGRKLILKRNRRVRKRYTKERVGHWKYTKK